MSFSFVSARCYALNKESTILAQQDPPRDVASVYIYVYREMQGYQSIRENGPLTDVVSLSTRRADANYQESSVHLDARRPLGMVANAEMRWLYINHMHSLIRHMEPLNPVDAEPVHQQQRGRHPSCRVYIAIATHESGMKDAPCCCLGCLIKVPIQL